MVHAVDADFAVAVDPFHRRAGLDDERVAVGEVGRVLVGDRPGQVLGDVQEQGAPLGDVEELHAGADAEHRHVAGADVLGEEAVEVLAPGVHRPHRRVGHVAVASWVEVGAADEHHAVEEIEEPDDVILVGERGEDDGDAPGGRDAVEVAGGDEGQGGVFLAGGAVVGVDADEGFGSHESS